MLEADGVGKVYGHGECAVTALSDVTLSVSPGEFVAICGPSGSGKTTLLSLLGLLDSPSSGVVRVDGRDAVSLSEDRRAELRRRQIGFVFQFFNLLPALTASENVSVPALLDGRSGSRTQERVRELLGLVGLADRADHRPDGLSGGEQQRVAIARALLADPSVVLADEPTGNLDTTTGQHVLELLVSATSAAGRCLVVVTHDAELARLADRVIELRDGRTICAVPSAGRPPKAQV